ncbi:hypothetical protein O0I10_003070 [Lichtheimia ornata]|uniref:Uncharacterized protein n=1 Tax=Lichtheimia ornata TaxID=688661 RepID=A0AAD7VAJ2_9FUNG|nr:uncharacterized protein O0I10_003070 [Lichtheimia ornata]KAJ8661320.1 hypothetical protein O0I10_003070 [Lichtheimia ornata]
MKRNVNKEYIQDWDSQDVQEAENDDIYAKWKQRHVEDHKNYATARTKAREKAIAAAFVSFGHVFGLGLTDSQMMDYVMTRAGLPARILGEVYGCDRRATNTKFDMLLWSTIMADVKSSHGQVKSIMAADVVGTTGYIYLLALTKDVYIPILIDAIFLPVEFCEPKLFERTFIAELHRIKRIVMTSNVIEESKAYLKALYTVQQSQTLN